MHIRHAKSGRALRTTRPVASIATLIRHHELLSTSSGPKFTSVLPTVETCAIAVIRLFVIGSFATRLLRRVHMQQPVPHDSITAGLAYHQ
jgi:hypothetical protein